MPSVFNPSQNIDLRRRLGSAVISSFFRGASALGRLHPEFRPERHGVEVRTDVSYADGRPEHAHRRLDVYLPAERSVPRPVVIYIHGGGFRTMSKDTHWLMALAFARRGYLVLNIDYSLAPANPFPAAVLDVVAAYRWALEHVERYGGDPTHVVLAGESAGANLSTTLALLTCYRRPEPWAQEVFELGRVPAAVVPACGIFQVSDIERFGAHVRSGFILERIRVVSESYVGRERSGPRPPDRDPLDLADPLVWLERAETPERPLPPFFAPVGARDPLLVDHERLAVALRKLGAHCEAPVYPGVGHAFHAFMIRREARRCWEDTFDFLERQRSTVGAIDQTSPEG